MNRRKFFFQTMAASTTVLLGSRVFYSCKKDDPVPVAGDYLDTTSIDKLNAAVLNATSLDSLPADITTAAASITTIMSQAEVNTYSTIDLGSVIQFYKTNTVISAEEKTKLQANDASTLSIVLNRMLQMPSFTSEDAVSNSSDAINRNSQLNAYSADNKAGGSDLYSGNYYQCAIDNQTFIQSNTIAKLEKISSLKSASTKSASIIQSSNDQITDELQIIVLLMILALAELFNFTQIEKALRTELKKLHIGG